MEGCSGRMEVIVLWMVVKWNSRVKALQGWWSVQFTDALMWHEKPGYGGAKEGPQRKSTAQESAVFTLE